MHRIDGAGATVDNKFTEGNPSTGVPATVVTGPWLNDIQEELMSILAAASITPVKGTQNQVLSALRKLAPGATGSMRNARMYIPTAAGAPTFTADEIIVSTAVGGLNYKLSGFSKVINGGSTGVGGMDVGTSPVSGFVAIYAIYNPAAALSATNPALLGVNATAAAQPEVYGGANMPAGYTASALVSVWPTTPGTAFAAGYQDDRTISIQKKAAITGGTSSTMTAVNIAGVVPRNAKSIHGDAVNNSLNSSVSICADINLTGQITMGIGNASPSTAPNFGFFSMPLIVPQTLYYSGSSPTTNNVIIEISKYTF